MNITREALVKRLSEKSGYWQKDVRTLLQAMDEVIVECFDEATEEEEVLVQVVEGIKLCCKIVPERERVHPSTQQPIICAPTTKPFVKFSEGFRDKIQKRFEERQE